MAKINKVKDKRFIFFVVAVIILVVIIGIYFFQNNKNSEKIDLELVIPPELAESPTLVSKIKEAENPESILIKQTPIYSIVYNQELNFFGVLVNEKKDYELTRKKVIEYFNALRVDTSKLYLAFYFADSATESAFLNKEPQE